MGHCSLKKEQSVGARKHLDGSQGNMMPGKKKKSHLKRLHTVSFHLYSRFEMTELWGWRTNWSPGVRKGKRKGGGCGHQRGA